MLLQPAVATDHATNERCCMQTRNASDRHVPTDLASNTKRKRAWCQRCARLLCFFWRLVIGYRYFFSPTPLCFSVSSILESRKCP